jgi:hypothetical protein
MEILTNPNLVYVLIVVGGTLIFLAKLNSKTIVLNIGVVFCSIAVILGILYSS